MVFDKFFMENVKKALRKLGVPFTKNCCENAKQVVQFNPTTGKLETTAPDGTVTVLPTSALGA